MLAALACLISCSLAKAKRREREGGGNKRGRRLDCNDAQEREYKTRKVFVLRCFYSADQLALQTQATKQGCVSS